MGKDYRLTGKEIQKVYLKYQYPKPDNNTIVSFPNNCRCNNPYSYLNSYYGRGQKSFEQENTLQSLYHDAILQKKIMDVPLEICNVVP